MTTQLLLAKRLFQEASEFAGRHDAVSCGLAISLLQDSAEMLVWALVKARGLVVKDGSAFTTNLELLQKDGLSIPETPRLLELNKARVGFKHYGNLPAPPEAQKFRTYVEDFLRSAAQAHFGKDFDRLSLVDLVPFAATLARLKSAEEHVERAEFGKAVHELSIAKGELFAKLDRYVPQVDHRICDVDGALAQVQELRGVQVFRYLANYLEVLRETLLVSLLRLPLEDYAFLTRTLFATYQTADGKWHTSSSRRLDYNEATCRRQIACLVEVSIRLQSIE